MSKCYAILAIFDDHMIQFEEFILSNGLEVIIHPDPSVSTVCVNTLYKVGSRNESPDKTGFAHLFEHLMFGGSKNVDSFDEQLQLVGGENNAFTSTDITNYYITVPSINLETALWLESDRMMSLSFDPTVLEVQRSVVVEEFKQRYLNQPYGDVWLKLRPEAYKQHPYRWPTIGKEIRHIEQATMEDVRSFFNTYYHPSNAILVLAGDISVDRGRKLVEKWFDDIPGRSMGHPTIPQEPPQTSERIIEAEAAVPQDAFYKVYHMPARIEDRYYSADLLSDLMGRGKSSLLYDTMVKEKNLLSSVSAFVSGSVDPGLLVLNGRLNPGVTYVQVEETLGALISALQQEKISGSALNKVKNMALSSIAFGEVDILNRAMSLAFAKFMGNIDLVNEEIYKIQSVTEESILEESRNILRKENCTTLYYKSKT